MLTVPQNKIRCTSNILLPVPLLKIKEKSIEVRETMSQQYVQHEWNNYFTNAILTNDSGFYSIYSDFQEGPADFNPLKRKMSNDQFIEQRFEIPRKVLYKPNNIDPRFLCDFCKCNFYNYSCLEETSIQNNYVYTNQVNNFSVNTSYDLSNSFDYNMCADFI